MSWPDHVVNGTTFQSAKNQFSNMESLPCDWSPTLRISLVRESDWGGEVAELMLEQAVASVRVLGCWEDFLLPAGG
jgi:hypothetical protein